MKLNIGNSSVSKNWAFLTCLLAATGVVANAGVVKAALNINLNYLGSDPNAQQGFEDAAAIWESYLDDPITVNLDVNFSSSGFSSSNVLGQNQSQYVGYTYTNVANALTADSTSSDDATATSNLPGISNSAFAFVGTEDNGSLEILDGYDAGTSSLTASADNAVLDVTRANAKALGLLTANDSGTDATITFNSNFAFDLDRSDGIQSGQFDFVGVALHEIGHALGFSSGVDIVDLNASGQLDSDSNTAGVQPYDLDGFRIFQPLDLYRYSDLSVAVGNDAGIPVLDLSVSGKDSGSVEQINYNGTDYDAEPYLSIDGGMNPLDTGGVEGLFSTGSNLGDGRQASHWKDDLGIGLLDPTIASGVQGDLTASDLRAFDIIGYDTTSASVPFEFSPTMGLVLVGSTWGFVSLRKRARM